MIWRKKWSFFLDIYKYSVYHVRVYAITIPIKLSLSMFKLSKLLVWFWYPIVFWRKKWSGFFLDIVSIGEKAKEVNAITGQINPSWRSLGEPQLFLLVWPGCGAWWLVVAQSSVESSNWIKLISNYDWSNIIRLGPENSASGRNQMMRVIQ